MQRVDRPVIIEWELASPDPERISGRKVVRVVKAWLESFFVGLVKVQRFYWHLEMESGKTIEVWQDEDGNAECSKVWDDCEEKPPSTADPGGPCEVSVE